MDTELETLEQALYRVRQMRNAKSGACSVPREVLVHIFECLQDMWPPRRGYAEEDPIGLEPDFYSGWICVTHVCSFWREVALQVPSLWSKPTLDILSLPHQYIPAILFRSHGASLDLRLQWDNKFDEIIDDSGLNAWLSPSILRRARRIDCYAGILIIQLVAARLPPTREVDQLRELDVYFDDHANQSPDLPAPLKNLMGVTKLSLQHCQVPWKSSLISSKLTYLKLWQGEGGPRPSYDEVSHLIALLQSLETMFLAEVVPPAAPSGSKISALNFPASLCRLTIYTFNVETTMDALNFASRIRTPPQCLRHYSLSSFRKGEHPNVALVDDALGRILPNLSFTDCGHINAQLLEITSISLRIIGSPVTLPLIPISPWDYPELEPGSIVNDLTLPGFTTETPPVNVRLDHYLPLIALEHLKVIALDASTVRHMARFDLWKHFLRAHNVRRLGVKGLTSAHKHLITLLNTLGRLHGHGTGETHILFPQLEMLLLPVLGDEVQHSDLIFTLVDLVHARREQGSPLQELVVPEETADWAVWGTLRNSLKVTPIKYPMHRSPLVPDSPIM
ncbi:hypothetical protein PENSPDRAFT_687119 [Peniophora sp. CONT]|nr:hypothetical protein PENSPDRAFT_687119 [Peniophora sp. CONT]